jgi:hypothetical protein
MKITRDIVTDLWPLYLSGEASPDSRTLVDEYLSQDPDFGRMLRANETDFVLKSGPVVLPPSLEARWLARTRKILQGRSRLRLLAAAFTGLAVVRVIEDAPWQAVSPQRCILTAGAAAILWAASFLFDRWGRGAIFSAKLENGPAKSA